MTGIDWTDPKSLVTPHFSVKEAIWLNKWNRLATEADGLNDVVKTNLVDLCQILEILRTDLFKYPINTHCMFRSENYNKDALKLKVCKDVHSFGRAIDFNVLPFYSIEAAKILLRPVLDKYNLRLEKNTPTWIHLDTYKVGPSGREFIA